MSDANTSKASKRQWGRRRIVAGLSGVAASAVAAPALAQFRFGFGGSDNDSGSGLNLDLGRILQGAQDLFEGLSLGEDDEIRIGNELFGRLVDKSGGAYSNAKAQAGLRRFADPLIATSGRNKLPWEVVLINDNTLNAWALPGGKIAVNKGVLRYAADEAELAAVLSHEIGHAELSHGIKQMRSKSFNKGLTALGREAITAEMGGSDAYMTDKLIDALEDPLFDMVTSGYSRGAEREADQHILTVFGRTGHDPSRAANFFKTMLQVTPRETEATNSLFSTHPDTQERIEKIEATASGMPAPTSPPPTDGFAAAKKSFPTRRRFRKRA